MEFRTTLVNIGVHKTSFSQNIQLASFIRLEFDGILNFS